MIGNIVNDTKGKSPTLMMHDAPKKTNKPKEISENLTGAHESSPADQLQKNRPLDSDLNPRAGA